MPETFNLPKTFMNLQSPEVKDEFIIVERAYSFDDDNLSIGLANILRSTKVS